MSPGNCEFAQNGPVGDNRGLPCLPPCLMNSIVIESKISGLAEAAIDVAPDVASGAAPDLSAFSQLNLAEPLSRAVAELGYE